jgi:hypothetical protein
MLEKGGATPEPVFLNGVGLYSPKCVEGVFSEVRSRLQEVTPCLWWKGLIDPLEVSKRVGKGGEHV